MSKAKYMRTMKPHDINQRRANAPRRAHAAVTADCATRGTATCPNRPEGKECKHVCGQERHYKTRAAVKETWMDEACGAPRQPNRPAAPPTPAVRPGAGIGRARGDGTSHRHSGELRSQKPKATQTGCYHECCKLHRECVQEVHHRACDQEEATESC